MGFLRCFLRVIVPAGGIAFVVLLFVTPFACKVTEEGILLETGDFSVPHLVNVKLDCDERIEFLFDKEICNAGAEIFGSEGEKLFNCDEKISGDCKQVEFVFGQKTVLGKDYIVKGCVSDAIGNSLTFSVPFKGFNSRVPEIFLSEVRNAYSSTGNAKSGVKQFKCEFIELFVNSDGNLAGIEILNAGDGEEKRFVFPECEVSKGQYVTVHLRKKEAGCIDETGTDLTLSSATDSCDTARDFWVENDKARLSSCDIILVRNSSNNKIYDCLVYSQDVLTQFPEKYKPYVEMVENSGKWTDENGNACCSAESAFICTGITSSAVTRTLSRNISEAQKKAVNSAEQWIVTASKGSGANKVPGDTPGLPNSTNAYGG